MSETHHDGSTSQLIENRNKAEQAELVALPQRFGDVADSQATACQTPGLNSGSVRQFLQELDEWCSKSSVNLVASAAN